METQFLINTPTDVFLFAVLVFSVYQTVNGWRYSITLFKDYEIPRILVVVSFLPVLSFLYLSLECFHQMILSK